MIIMVKKILICSICLMLLLGVSVSAQREMPQGNPPSNMEIPQGNPPSGMQRPQGTPPEGMELPEGAEPPQGMPEDREVFSGGEQGQRPQGNTDNTQLDAGQPTNEAGENANQPQGQDVNGEVPQNQNGNQMTPPDMDFGVGNMPSGFGKNNTPIDAEQVTFMGFVKEYQTPIISVVLLLLAFVFVKLYKRKNY